MLCNAAVPLSQYVMYAQSGVSGVGGGTESRLSCPHLHASTSLRWKAFVSGICKSWRELHVDKATALMHSFAADLEAGGKADGIFQE